jgi:hypothetical protein
MKNDITDGYNVEKKIPRHHYKNKCDNKRKPKTNRSRRRVETPGYLLEQHRSHLQRMNLLIMVLYEKA